MADLCGGLIEEEELRGVGDKQTWGKEIGHVVRSTQRNNNITLVSCIQCNSSFSPGLMCTQHEVITFDCVIQDQRPLCVFWMFPTTPYEGVLLLFSLQFSTFVS